MIKQDTPKLRFLTTPLCSIFHSLLPAFPRSDLAMSYLRGGGAERCRAPEAGYDTEVCSHFREPASPAHQKTLFPILIALLSSADSGGSVF